MHSSVRVENVWKSYLLGGSAHFTLKDAFASALHRVRTGRKRSKEPFWALKDVSFEVEEGESVGLIGRNGAGKSTMFKLLARITLPTRGHALIRGRVGSLLEVGTGFHPELTGRDNVFLNGAILGMSRAETQRKFDEIVQFAEVEKFIDTPVKRYSSGMQMRLAFSVAAHLEPDVMLIDEVLAVGDQEFQNKCMGRVTEIENEGRTVMFVSHNMGAIRRLCRRAILLNRGSIVADGSVEQVTQAYYELIAPEADGGTLEQGVDNKPAILRRWTARSAGTLPEYVLNSNSSCTFRFEIDVMRPLKDTHFQVAIFTPDGILATRVDSLDRGGSFVRLDPGTAEIHFDISSLPLRAGLYDVHLELRGRRQGRLESWAARPNVRVVDDASTTSTQEFARGLVMVESRFSMPSSPGETLNKAQGTG